MPKGSDWINFVYVNLGFLAQILTLYYFSALLELKKNWPQHRCNPLFMPFADDVNKNFVHCVQTSQTSFMGYVLAPIEYLVSVLTSFAGDITQTIQSVRIMLSNIRTYMASIAKELYGVFFNIIIEFQKVVINLKDLMGKMIGIMVSLMYVMEGSMMTMQSAWNGPPGQMTRAIGNCFHPSTKLRLANNKIVCMKDVNVGDILSDGSKVKAVMKIDNSLDEELYVIRNKGINKSDIYVTGTHMMYDEEKKKYVEVREHPAAGLQNQYKFRILNNLPIVTVKSSWFSCLITTKHKIPIGDCLFWDWEDDILKR